MNITISTVKNLHGESLKLILRKSFRKLGKPRSRFIAGLGSIRVAHLSDAARVEEFLARAVQKLFAQGLSTGRISNLISSLARRIPAFKTFFENLKF